MYPAPMPILHRVLALSVESATSRLLRLSVDHNSGILKSGDSSYNSEWSDHKTRRSLVPGKSAKTVDVLG